MLTLNLNTKEDVHRLRERLRTICDQEGIRLGKTNARAERIIASLVGVRDYNTLIGMVERRRIGK